MPPPFLTALEDLRRRWPGLERFLQAPCHVIRLPFAYAQFDDSDGRPGWLWSADLIPRGLTPRSTLVAHPGVLSSEFADPPYPELVLLGPDPYDPTVLLVQSKKLAAGEGQRVWAHQWKFGDLDVGSEAHDLLSSARWSVVGILARPVSGWEVPLTATARFLVGAVPIPHPIDRHQVDPGVRARQPSPDEAWALLRHRTDEMMHGVEILTGKRVVCDEDRHALGIRALGLTPLDAWDMSTNDAAWITKAIVVACSLMNARNVVTERLEPKQDRASRRRGELPPLSYHEVKICASRKGTGLDAMPASAPVAIHWVRGHFKQYTAAAPLFGTRTGLFFPHWTCGRCGETAWMD